MARKRKVVDDEKPNTDFGDATKELGGTRKARKRFVGIRQRPSGRWVAEIKDTIQKIRMWLGTFDTAEEAARAYDEAACLLRGANTRTNFWPTSPNSSPALPSKITNLLLSRLKARNNALAANNNFEPSSPPRTDQNQENQYLYASDFPDILYEDFSLENFSRAISDYKYPILETGEGHEMQTGALDSIQYCSENTEISENENDVEEGNATGLEDVDFEFVDETGWSAGCSAFDLAEEMEKPMEAEEDEAVMMSEAMRRMTYERKFSASLYAFSGVTEYLNLKLKKSSLEGSEQLSGLWNACKSKQEEMVSSKDKEDHSSDFDDAELSLWSSIDLHPLCFVNKSKTHRRDVH